MINIGRFVTVNDETGIVLDKGDANSNKIAILFKTEVRLFLAPPATLRPATDEEKKAFGGFKVKWFQVQFKKWSKTRKGRAIYSGTPGTIQQSARIKGIMDRPNYIPGMEFYFREPIYESPYGIELVRVWTDHNAEFKPGFRLGGKFQADPKSVVRVCTRCEEYETQRELSGLSPLHIPAHSKEEHFDIAQHDTKDSLMDVVDNTNNNLN